MLVLRSKLEVDLEVVKFFLGDPEVLGLAGELAGFSLFLLEEGLEVMVVGGELLKTNLLVGFINL